MKKYLIPAIALLALVSCEKETVKEYPVPEAGTAYVLEGTVNTEGFTWKTNSAVGLYSAQSNLRILNKECKIFGWADTTPVIDEETGENTNKYTPSEYEGKPTAKFNTPGLDLVQGENRFMIYSPYNAELAYVDGIIMGLSIGDEQIQSAPNVAADCFSVGYATAIPGVDETFKFELNPVTALAKVKITSEELSAYAPSKVTIFDDNKTAIAGDFDIDVNTMTITPLSGSELSQVSVEVVSPVSLSSVKEQNIYLNILSADYSGKEVWVIVEMVNEAEGKKVTIPTRQTGLKFEAGKTTEINLVNLKLSDNAAGAWYCAEDARHITAEGVAYGEANTYFIQCKNGSTYAGATYSANPAIPESVVIDYRARGDFAKAFAAKPENVTFEWATLKNGNLVAPRSYPLASDYESSGVVIKDKFAFEQNSLDYKVTVTNNGAFAGTPILLMKNSEGRTLWAWTFWNIAADGTTLDPVTVGGYKFAPMDIGQPTTKMETWTANKSGTMANPGSNPDPIYRMIHYYQWGRPIPTFWTTYWSLDVIGGEKSGNVPAVLGPVTIKTALENPYAMIAYPGDVTALSDWSSETAADLWGEVDIKKEGVKSIYDPCPKGWRVASWPALDAVAALKSSAQFNDNAVGAPHAKVGDLVLLDQGRQTAKDPTGKTQYRPENIGMGNAANAGASKEGFIWSNVAGAAQGQGLFVTNDSHSSEKKELRIASFDRKNAAAVRCIVDESNR